MPPFCSPVAAEAPATSFDTQGAAAPQRHRGRRTPCAAPMGPQPPQPSLPAAAEASAAAAAAASADPMNSATVGMMPPARRLVDMVAPIVPVPRTAKKLVGALMYVTGTAQEAEALLATLLQRVGLLFSARGGRPAGAADARRLVECWRNEELPGRLAKRAPHHATVRAALSGQDDADFVASTATALTQPAFTLLNLLFVHVVEPALVRPQQGETACGSVRRRRAGSRSPSVSPGLTHSAPPTPGGMPALSLCGEAEEAAEAAAVAAALAVYGMARMQTWDSKDVCQMLSYTVNMEDQLGALKLRVVSVGSAQRRAQTQDKVELRFMPQTEDKRAVVAALLLGLKCVWFNPSWDSDKVRGYARRCARDVALPSQWVAAVEDEAEAVWAQTKARVVFCRPEQERCSRQVLQALPEATGRAQLKIEVLYRLQQFPDSATPAPPAALAAKPPLAGSTCAGSPVAEADVDVDVGSLAKELEGGAFRTPADTATPVSAEPPSTAVDWNRVDEPSEPAAWSQQRIDAAARRAGVPVSASSLPQQKQQRGRRRSSCRQQRQRNRQQAGWLQ